MYSLTKAGILSRIHYLFIETYNSLIKNVKATDPVKT